MDYSAYAQTAPDIGLNSHQIRILSEQGRARIAAENAAKQAKRTDKQEEGMHYKGWKGTMEQGLELFRGMVRSVGVGMTRWEKEQVPGGRRQDYEKMG